MKMFRRVVVLLGVLTLAIGLADPSQAQLFGRKNNDADVRLNDMEERLRNLTGQIEQLTYQLREIQDQMRRMQEDNEYRFQQLEGGNPNTPGKRSDAAPSGTNSSASLGAPPQNLGTIGGAGDQSASAIGNEPTANGGPIDLSQLAGGLNAPADIGVPSDPGTEQTGDSLAGLINSDDPRGAYDAAYSLVIDGRYQEAAAAFKQFIANYPDNRLAANAHYWLGESLYSQGNYRDAADAFLKTYTDYPGTEKGADSLLKLGMSLKGLGEADAACATYSELLTKFPSAAPAVLQQAREERQRAKCS